MVKTTEKGTFAHVLFEGLRGFADSKNIEVNEVIEAVRKINVKNVIDMEEVADLFRSGRYNKSVIWLMIRTGIEYFHNVVTDDLPTLTRVNFVTDDLPTLQTQVYDILKAAFTNN